MKLALLSGRSGRLVAALFVSVVIAGIGVWAQNPALVGINYDDGIYALLGKALADGQGYRYTFLPLNLPAVKYPPVYPLSLAPFWALAESQQAALHGMKVANGIYIGLAAGLFALLLSTLRLMPTLAAGGLAVLGFASGSMMLVTAGVLSEPLYLALLFFAILVADAVGTRQGVWGVVAAGALAGTVALTRSIGIALVAAVAIGLWRREGRRAGLTALAAALVLIVPWLVFTAANAGEIPEVLVPRYGSYTQLYVANLGGSVVAALEIFSSNLGAILQTLGGKLAPQLAAVPRSLVGGLLLSLAALGSIRVFRKAPVVALYPWLYLALITVWSFPPFRFLFILFPLLLALAALSLPALAERAAGRRSGYADSQGNRAWARFVIVGAALAMLINLAFFDLRAVKRRVWDGAEYQKSVASGEVVDWVRRQTPPQAVIAYEFDPLIALYTGRRVVPNNYEPVHIWYRRDEPPLVPLAEMFVDMGVDYVAVRHDVPLAAAPIEALLEEYPGVLRLAHVAPRGAYVFEADLRALQTDRE